MVPCSLVTGSLDWGRQAGVLRSPRDDALSLAPMHGPIWPAVKKLKIWPFAFVKVGNKCVSTRLGTSRAPRTGPSSARARRGLFTMETLVQSTHTDICIRIPCILVHHCIICMATACHGCSASDRLIYQRPMHHYHDYLITAREC